METRQGPWAIWIRSGCHQEGNCRLPCGPNESCRHAIGTNGEPREKKREKAKSSVSIGGCDGDDGLTHSINDFSQKT
eukprot:scaffold7770_cov134-Skeletonema_dohrnii-CCMP3373.AAC.1